MTFYRTPQRQSFDANIFEESMIDYGEQVAVQDDLGVIGGMLGYGNIYHDPNSPDLPTTAYMSGNQDELVGITGHATSFPGVGVVAEKDSRGRWGLRIIDAGVWQVIINFKCTASNGGDAFQITITPQSKHAGESNASRFSKTHANYADVIVEDQPGRLVVPIASGTGRWTEGEMAMTMYRIDGGSSTFTQNNIRKARQQ